MNSADSDMIKIRLIRSLASRIQQLCWQASAVAAPGGAKTEGEAAAADAGNVGIHSHVQLQRFISSPNSFLPNSVTLLNFPSAFFVNGTLWRRSIGLVDYGFLATSLADALNAHCDAFETS